VTTWAVCTNTKEPGDGSAERAHRKSPDPHGPGPRHGVTAPAERWGELPDEGATRLPIPRGLRMRLQTIMRNAEHIYSIADNHAQTVQVCIDRLHKLGANEQLKLLTARLQKLAVQATLGDDDKGTKAAQRQRGERVRDGATSNRADKGGPVGKDRQAHGIQTR
jgi:hypothetical protein